MEDITFNLSYSDWHVHSKYPFQKKGVYTILDVGLCAPGDWIL